MNRRRYHIRYAGTGILTAGICYATGLNYAATFLISLGVAFLAAAAMDKQ